jgi:hypothetical protein
MAEPPPPCVDFWQMATTASVAESAKERGNAAFAQAKYEEAVEVSRSMLFIYID